MKRLQVLAVLPLWAVPLAAEVPSLPYIPPPPDSPDLLPFLRDTSLPKLAYTTYIGWYEDGGLNESVLFEQVEAMATKLRPHGWTHILHDYGWQVCGSTFHLTPGCINIDQYARILPSPQRYPSAYFAENTGSWKPVVDRIHAKGLAYGLHLIHGIPKVAAQKKLPILGTVFTADELVAEPRCDTFIPDNWKINSSHPGAQAYYDSIVSLWAEQGIDFIYFDGVVGEPCGCHVDAVALMSDSLRRLGNGMHLFTSYGPPDRTGSCSFDELTKLAPYVRVGSDTVDSFSGPGDQGSIFNGFSMFTRFVAPSIGPHHFGDLAGLMIGKVHCPLGTPGCYPGPDYYIPSNRSVLTKDEVISYASMVAIFRSTWWPSGVLTEMDDFMYTMLTNDAVIRVTMMSKNTREVVDGTSLSFDGPGIVWTADDTVEAWKYVLLVNLCPCPQGSGCGKSCPGSVEYTVVANFKELGLTPTTSCNVTELWGNQQMGKATGSLEATLRPHASLLVRLSDCQEADTVEASAAFVL